MSRDERHAVRARRVEVKNADPLAHVATRGYVLETGRIVLEYSAQKLMNNEQVKRSY